MHYRWDDAKRLSNLGKHGLDFADADLVLANPLRMEVESTRRGELRRQAFAYVFEMLMVLTVAYVPGATPRIISFRRAARSERSVYLEWLENDFHVDR